MVDVDAPVDVCRTELCEVAGVELSSAPRRPINYKTLLKKMDFLPYGENLDKDAKRLAYYKQIRGYIKALVEPAINAHGAASADGMPDHLQKVSLGPIIASMAPHACAASATLVVMHRPSLALNMLA